MLEVQIARNGLKMSSIAARKSVEGSRSMRFLLSRKSIRRGIAALWVVAFVWQLVRILLFRSAPPQALADAEYLEQLYIFALSEPLSGLIVWPLKWVSFSWWVYPGNDPRTIIAIWLSFFTIGCLQWFVLVPWAVHKAFDLYDFVVHKVRRK
jgi:hypothetical protein